MRSITANNIDKGINKMKHILESTDITLYKKLLDILSDYYETAPCAGVYDKLNLAMAGKKILPKDKRAEAILTKLLSQANSADAVQKLLNMRFADVQDKSLRPLTREGHKYRLAFWTRSGFTSDRVRDLIDWEATGKEGFWSDINGKKVTLISKEQ